MTLADAIAVFDKSADRTRPNAQTEAWAVIRAELMRVMGAPVVRTNVTRINCCGGDPCDDPSGYCTDRCRRLVPADGGSASG